MRSSIIYIILGLLFYSCQLGSDSKTDSENNINPADLPAPETTAYEFDPDLKLPSGFYFDTLSVYDSTSRAHYVSRCIQSSLPEMEEFNQAIITALEERVKYEQSYVDPYSGDDPIYTVFTYELGVVDFFVNDEVISLCHIVDCYTWGGNHHNYSWYTFNYDLKMNRPIDFKDIFNLPDREDSIAFVAFTHRHKEDEGCMGWRLPFDSVDFSFDDSGIYINPDLSWACILTRSLLPADSLDKFIREEWMDRI